MAWQHSTPSQVDDAVEEDALPREPLFNTMPSCHTRPIYSMYLVPGGTRSAVDETLTYPDLLVMVAKHNAAVQTEAVLDPR